MKQRIVFIVRKITILCTLIKNKIMKFIQLMILIYQSEVQVERFVAIRNSNFYQITNLELIFSKLQLFRYL